MGLSLGDVAAEGVEPDPDRRPARGPAVRAVEHGDRVVRTRPPSTSVEAPCGPLSVTGPKKNGIDTEARTASTTSCPSGSRPYSSYRQGREQPLAGHVARGDGQPVARVHRPVVAGVVGAQVAEGRARPGRRARRSASAAGSRPRRPRSRPGRRRRRPGSPAGQAARPEAGSGNRR